MNAAANTYDLFVPALTNAETLNEAAPTDSFVTGLVTSLVWTFDLDEVEREVALLLLFGRPLGVIARRLAVCATSAQRICKSLFATTCTDGREKLFELALRLTTMRELSKFAAGPQARPELPPAPSLSPRRVSARA